MEVNNRKASFLRYPGGKQRYIKCLLNYLPDISLLSGKYIEPFVGGASVFLSLNPKRALLSDINPELITLYKGIKKDPEKVWNLYQTYPSDRGGYYEVRDKKPEKNIIVYKAARTLYLNRTCFKGMWRHNSKGQFNVGYGGQSRRWVISCEDLIDASLQLKNTSLKCSDFGSLISKAVNGDFIFLDPPYSPGEMSTIHNHYMFGTFGFNDQYRLAETLERATKRGVLWAMTNSSHKEITGLYDDHEILPINRMLNGKKGEVLVKNY
jgi:DNA adenine methylase